MRCMSWMICLYIDTTVLLLIYSLHSHVFLPHRWQHNNNDTMKDDELPSTAALGDYSWNDTPVLQRVLSWLHLHQWLFRNSPTKSQESWLKGRVLQLLIWPEHHQVPGCHCTFWCGDVYFPSKWREEQWQVHHCWLRAPRLRPGDEVMADGASQFMICSMKGELNWRYRMCHMVSYTEWSTSDSSHRLCQSTSPW